MNWTVKGNNQTITEEWDHCEHLKVGEVAPYMVGEQDSFGPVARYGMCKECHVKHLTEQDESLENCSDCGQLFKLSELTEWRWYDFYPAQGDEPLNLCKTCCCSEKHKRRKERDARDYENEMQHYEKGGY